MPTESPILEGVTFDHYQVLTRSDGALHELGRGAMGITYKALDMNLRVPVALKVINTHSLDSETERSRFVQEARSAAKLRHPHVASVFHLGAEGETYFYAMEFIDGETVEALVKRRGPLPPVVALRLALQVSRALAAAEQHGLVHRDIKPSNLMLVSEEHELCVKVIDFGLALTARSEEARAAGPAAGGAFVGTPHYASPEQLQSKEVDIRSDIYSLGATLWYMLMGEPVFTGPIARVMSQHLTAPLPEEKLAGLPPPIAEQLRRMLAKKPEERPQSASELRREIDLCLEQASADGGGAGEEERGIAEETAQRRGASPVSDFLTRNIVAEHLEVLQRLGETNEGWVFQARDLTSLREVRLLVLRQDFSEIPQAFTLLEREVERLSSAHHPNLLRVDGLETIDATVVVVLEWTQGVTLREVLRIRRDLSASEVLELLRQMAAGVDFAAKYDVRQLDLALHQIFLHVPDLAEVPEALLQRPLSDWPKFIVKLNPLSITRELSASETWKGDQTIVGDTGGAPAGAAVGNLGARYTRALAALTYELLGGVTKPVVAAAGGATRYTPLANLTEEGNDVLRRALDPARSFSHAEDFLRALLQVDQLESRHYEGGAGRTHASPAFPPAPVAPALVLPPRRKSAWPEVLAAAGVVSVLGAGGYFLLRPEPEAPVAAIGGAAPEVPETEPSAPEPSEPTPEPSPPPTTPMPDPRALLNAAVAEAERIESGKNVAQSIGQWLGVARDFPDAEIGRMRLELLLDGMRLRNAKLPPDELGKLAPGLEEAARMGVVSAMLLLAESWLPQDAAAAFRWYSAAAEKGVPSALTQLGLMYSNGAGVERDLEKAVKYFEQGSQKGDPAATAALAECLLYGRGVEKNLTGAIELLQQAVSKGNVRAMNRLGTCYHQGVGVEKNFSEAARLFQNAVDQRFAQAYGNLGVLYIKGEGVPANPRKAVELFQKGAREEDPFCMFLYAQSLEAGMGLTANLVEARSWYRRAAEAGMPRAAEWCRKNNVAFDEQVARAAAIPK